MATIFISGQPLERTLLRHRIAADKVEMLTLPLTVNQRKCLLEVSVHDAWLPLSLAFLQGLHRLWTIVAGGPGYANRTPHEDLAYVVLRASFLAMLQSRADLAHFLEEVQIQLPKRLLTTSRVPHLTVTERSEFNDTFETLRCDLIEVAVSRKITSDVYTVSEIMKPYHRAIDRIEQAHIERVLDRSIACGLTRNQIRSLKQRSHQLWRLISDQEDYRIAIAIEVVGRLQEIWNLLYPDLGSLSRYEGDEAAYQAYRHLLLRGLSILDSESIQSLAHEMLPSLLPSGSELAASNPLFAEMGERFSRIRNELVSFAMKTGTLVSVDGKQHPDIDEDFEEGRDHWNLLKEEVNRARESMTSPGQSQQKRRKHNGRPPASLPYEEAAALYWLVFEDLGDKQPNAILLIDWLR